MTKPRMFIGSSKESLSIAEAAYVNLGSVSKPAIYFVPASKGFRVSLLATDGRSNRGTTKAGRATMEANRTAVSEDRPQSGREASSRSAKSC